MVESRSHCAQSRTVTHTKLSSHQTELTMTHGIDIAKTSANIVLVTFKDSNWLMSVVLPHQPHYLKQPEGVTVWAPRS